MLQDERGLTLTTESVDAVSHHDEAIRHFFQYRRSFGPLVKQVVEADPDFALGHCLRGYLFLMFATNTVHDKAARSLEKAEALAKSSAQIVVYKKGPEGAVTFAGDTCSQTGIYEVDAIKPTGAGDSFMAGFLASLSEGRTLHESVLRGSASASIVVSRPGCAPAMPDGPKLEKFLASHPGPTDF